MKGSEGHEREGVGVTDARVDPREWLIGFNKNFGPDTEIGNGHCAVRYQ
jgi:hypothetical protein